MGARGPHAKPTNLKILHGDRPDRINFNEPEPAMGTVVPPYELGEVAQEVWDRLGPDLVAKKVLTPWDVDAFALFCDAVETFRVARHYLHEEGYTAQGAAGGVIKSPYWQIMRDSADIITKVGGRFGLNPSDRANIVMEGGNDLRGAGAERLLS